MPTHFMVFRLPTLLSDISVAAEKPLSTYLQLSRKLCTQLLYSTVVHPINISCLQINLQSFFI